MKGVIFYYSATGNTKLVSERIAERMKIEMDPKPVFDMTKCYGCWSCFNRCPNKAIYTNKMRGKGHYTMPLENLIEKLK